MLKNSLLILALLTGCVNNEPAQRARSIAGSGAECTHSNAKSGLMGFCFNGWTLVICTQKGCIQVPVRNER